LILAALHLALVGTLGAKLLADRATRPRVWVETAPYDPNLPIRGRYVRLQIVVEATDMAPPAESDRWRQFPVTLSVENDRLVARPEPGVADPYGMYDRSVRFIRRGEDWIAVLSGPVAFFITEHIEDPSRRAPDETLWVEVTLPRKGPPRPIRLGVKKGGTLTPLDLD
jgi:hypothetical protein